MPTTKSKSCPSCGTTIWSDSKQCVSCYEHSLRQPKPCNKCGVIILYEECSSHQWSRGYCRNCMRDRNNRIRNTHRHRDRQIVIEHYGGKCACCGEIIYEFLAIDHVNGGGRLHRRQIGHGRLARWLIKNNFPDGFQILCHNCNFAKSNGGCPHKQL